MCPQVQAVKAAVCSHTPTAECREMAETLVPGTLPLAHKQPSKGPR